MHDLLSECMQKQADLQGKAPWSSQLLNRCPPVLWFGDSTTSAQRIVTIGANPSRQEYLADGGQEAVEKIERAGDQSRLSFLNGDSQRLYRLSPGTQMREAAEDSEVLTSVLNGYDEYFEHNPYTSWFGHPKEDSYYVEGFLRGFGASYYTDSVDARALHIDLFPFATVSDFSSLEGAVASDLFEDGWALSVLLRLIEFLDPDVLIAFGSKNVGYFEEYVDPSIGELSSSDYPDGTGSFRIGRSEKFDRPFIGLSTNLGSPHFHGFTSESIQAYGSFIRSELARIGPNVLST